MVRDISTESSGSARLYLMGPAKPHNIPVVQCLPYGSTANF